jgi:hypothetical protein
VRRGLASDVDQTMEMTYEVGHNRLAEAEDRRRRSSQTCCSLLLLFSGVESDGVVAKWDGGGR